MQVVNDLLRELERNHFYGSIEVKLEAGRIVLMRKTETIRPETEDYRNNRGMQDEQRF